MAGRRVAPSPPTARELTHLLKYRSVFSNLTAIWLGIGILFFLWIGSVAIYSWMHSEPAAVTADLFKILGIGLGLDGTGLVAIPFRRVYKFYYPLPSDQ